MPDRVASDNPGVESHRAVVERAGATRRPRLIVGDAVPADAVVRLVVDGDERFAPTAAGDGGTRIEGAFDSARLARDRAGPNRLAAWLEDAGVGFGRSVALDVVTPGYKYGLRRPGDRAVYDAAAPPSASLQGIAERLDGDR